MKSRQGATVNEQIDHLRKQVLGFLAAGFVVLFISGFLAIHYYQKAQSDLHRGSCSGRLALVRILQHAMDQAQANPDLTPAQKKQNANFFKSEIALVDISDCFDVHLPPLPLPSAS